MTRARRVTVYASAFVFIYFLVFFAFVPIPFFEPSIVAQLLPIVPWWVLVSFGAYSLASLGWGLFTFQDCPDAYYELLKEINDAKNDLRRQGVTVD